MTTLFYPETYGAIPNGIFDSTTAIQDAIDAAEAVGGVVVYSVGTYRITTTLQVTSRLGMRGAPGSIVHIDASDLTLIRIADTAIGTVIEDIVFRGNSSGAGNAAWGDAGGYGIRTRGPKTRVARCRFEAFGLPAPSVGFASPIFLEAADGSTVDSCYFAGDNHNKTGADILGSGNDQTVTNNVSESECDAFCSLGGSGGREVITGNIARRASESSTARSAILLVYGEYLKSAAVANNVIEGFGWHGIYMTTAFPDPNEDYGGAAITGNVLRFCGGRLSPDGNTWNTAAIRLSGHGGTTVSGNYIYGSGYTPAFEPRANTDSNGIFVGSRTSNFTITGNTIRKCRQHGIVLSSGGAEAGEGQFIADGVVSANNVSGCASSAIVVNPYSSSSWAVDGEIRRILIQGNTLAVPVDGAHGIAQVWVNGSWTNQIDMVDNLVVCTAASPTAGSGIWRSAHSTLTRGTGRVSGNTVRGFHTGITCAGTIALYVPLACRIDGNVIEACVEGMALGGTDYQVFEDCVFRGITSAAYLNRARPGRILATINTSRPTVEIFSDAVPTAGAWIAGDLVTRVNRRGPLVGYQCTVSGTPGTWAPVYTDLAFGYKCSATPKFNSTVLDVRGIEDADEVVGTPTSRTWDTNRYYTRAALLEVLDTSAGTNSIGGIRSDSADFARVVPFYTRLIWAPATGMSVATRRAFAGMIASTSAPTDVNPSTLVNILGMGWDDADTQVQVFHCGATGPATKVALGASFPRPTADRTLVYALEIWNGGSGGTPTIQVTELTTGIRATEVFAAFAASPAASVPLCPYSVWASVGGTNGVAGVAFGGFEGWRAC